MANLLFPQVLEELINETHETRVLLGKIFNNGSVSSAGIGIDRFFVAAYGQL